MSVNRHILLGNLGKDPELRTLQSGKKVCSFSLATSRKGKDGQEKTTWHNVVIYNEKLAELVSQYRVKGDSLYVEGELEIREYEKDGAKRLAVETVIGAFGGTVDLVGRSKREGGAAPAKAAQQEAPMIDDEVPF